MRSNSKDITLKKNYIQKYQFLMEEYELVKEKKHSVFKSVAMLYEAHGVCRQVFWKYYRRYKNSGNKPESLIPGKRGPTFKARRTPEHIEQEVLKQRALGFNKFEITDTLRPVLENKTPSPSTVYCILKRYGVNKKIKEMKEEKKRIIKTMVGELGHVDAHHLSKDMIATDSRRYYLVGLIDSLSSLAWVEVVTDIKALSVMFAVLRCMNYLKLNYEVKFSNLLTDNGPEFGPRTSKVKEDHPFERLLIEMGIKHNYIKPGRPQTNGKIERFWRTLNDDLINGTHFESIDHFKKELLDYNIYYNQLRPHQTLGGKTPKDFAETCHRIT